MKQSSGVLSNRVLTLLKDTRISPEDGNRSVCRNVSKPSTFCAAYFPTPKSHIKLQLQKPNEKGNHLGILLQRYNKEFFN
jgi:hypothetical protein